MLKVITRRWQMIFVLCLAAVSSAGIASTAFAASGPSSASGSSAVRKAQQELQSDGYYQGNIDGEMGPKTRAAIRQYQKAQHLPVTGRLSGQTATKLGVRESAGGDFRGAGRSVGRGGKQFGHGMKKGKPVEGGKNLGKSLGHAGKDVGKGVKKSMSTH
ncbi:MAG: peptidoglycan-binding domain-containing protein [Terriglobia bacterium]